MKWEKTARTVHGNGETEIRYEYRRQYNEYKRRRMEEEKSTAQNIDGQVNLFEEG